MLRVFPHSDDEIFVLDSTLARDAD